MLHLNGTRLCSMHLYGSYLNNRQQQCRFGYGTKKLNEGGCLCTRKGSGRPKTSDETVERVSKNILQSPWKSLRRTSLETQFPQATVWRILRKRLIMKPYKLQLVQAITEIRRENANRIDVCHVSGGAHIEHV